jgi:predicted Fe-Mo cluster-binding NifX family protein
MTVGVACTGQTLDADVFPQFGRCPYLLIVNAESLDFDAIANAAAGMPGGAGPATVQELSNRGVTVAIAGEFGPKAQRALELAGIRSVRSSGPVRDALAAL